MKTGEQGKARRRFRSGLLPVLILFLLLGDVFSRGEETGGPGGGDPGLSLAPFAPERRTGLRISDPAGLRLGREGGRWGLDHFVEFPGRKEPVEVRAELPVYGREGETFSARLSGRAILRSTEKGAIRLRLLYKGSDLLSRTFHEPGTHPFALSLELWGGEGYEVALSAEGGAEGRVENLLMEYEAAPFPAPFTFRRYHAVTPLPPEVETGNTLRYLEVLNRDLSTLGRLLFWGGLYLFLLLASAFLARRLLQASRRKGTAPSMARKKRRAAYVLAGCFLLLLLPPAGELLYRLGSVIARKEPLLLTYPFGFDTENPGCVSYARGRPVVFARKERSRTVTCMSKGVERACYGTSFYHATVNEAGYRGPLKLLPGGRTVVYCVGGASTYGFTDDGETFPDFVQAALDRRAPGRFTVFNLGVPGLSPDGFAERTAGLFTVRPDVIVLYAGFDRGAVSPRERFAAALEQRGRCPLIGLSRCFLTARDFLAGRLERCLREGGGGSPRSVGLDWDVLYARAEAYVQKIDAVFRYAETVGAKVLYVNEYGRMGPAVTLDVFQRFSTPQGRAAFLRRSRAPFCEKMLLACSLCQVRIRGLVERKGYLHVMCVEPACFKGVDPDTVLLDEVDLNALGNRLLGEFTAGKLLALVGGGSGEAEPRSAGGGKDLLAGVAWSLPETAKLDPGKEGDTFRSARSKLVLSKTVPEDRLPAKPRILEVSLQVEAGRPLVLLSARLEAGGTVLALNEKGRFLGPGLQTFTWRTSRMSWKGRVPLRVELSFSGMDPHAWIRVKALGLTVR